MIESAKRIKESLDKVIITQNDLSEICKDRLDFGFDSIYFRYATAMDELAIYKGMYKAKEKGVPIIESIQQEIRHSNNYKMHFYQVLEQFVHAHKEE